MEADLVAIFSCGETVLESAVMSLTHTGGVGLPENGHSLPLAGSAVGDEGLAVAVFMDRTLTHVRHTRPTNERQNRLQPFPASVRAGIPRPKSLRPT